MVGFGTVNGTDRGTLETMTRTENKFPNLIDSAGNFIARQDVRYRGVISGIGNGPLAPGFGANSSNFGPELGFGHVMGWYHDEPVLLLKTSHRQPQPRLGHPAARQPVLSVYGGTNYAGYGDRRTTGRWAATDSLDPGRLVCRQGIRSLLHGRKRVGPSRHARPPTWSTSSTTGSPNTPDPANPSQARISRSPASSGGRATRIATTWATPPATNRTSST